MPHILYQSSGWTTHRQYKLRTLARPIDRDQAHLVITRYWRGAISTYANTALNTVDAEFNGTGGLPTAYLVENGPVTFVDGDEMEYTQIYATIPADRDDYDTYGYTYPAFIDGNGFERRSNVTFSVTRRVANTYFLVTPGTGTYPTPGSFATITRQRYVLTYYPAPATPAYADVTFVRNADAFGTLTTPDLDTYTALTTATPPANEIIAEDSHLENYMGNIWRRYTGYIPAI